MADYEYSFGRLVWQGEIFRKDLIILPDRILTPWVRDHGHRLSFDDLAEIMTHPPRILIIGTGHRGVMKVPDEVLDELVKAGVDGRPMPTGKALEHLVDLRAEGKEVAAALHLTC